jgi:hypothetical protein
MVSASGLTSVIRSGTLRDASTASAAVKEAAQAGKCWEAAEKEVKLPKYESWPGYEQNLQFVLRRYCALWGRGT